MILLSDPASTEKFGTREFVKLVVALMAEYLRHEVNINTDIPSGVQTALATILANLPALLALNPPGPE